MKRAEATLTREQVAAVENMVDLVRQQNDDFYREHPDKERLVDDTKLDALRFTLMEHILKMRTSQR